MNIENNKLNLKYVTNFFKYLIPFLIFNFQQHQKHVSIVIGLKSIQETAFSIGLVNFFEQGERRGRGGEVVCGQHQHVPSGGLGTLSSSAEILRNLLNDDGSDDDDDLLFSLYGPVILGCFELIFQVQRNRPNLC